MTEPTQSEGMTAVLLQLAGLTQKLSDVEHRHAGDVREIRDQFAAVAAAAEQLKATVAGHAEALAAVNGLDTQVADLAARLGQADPGVNSPGYQPSPTPKFWKLDGPGRDQVIGKLRAWVDQIYRPGYGHLSASLGECWDQHPLCLYLLDWLSELWSVLYLSPSRTTATLAGQAEWQTRLLGAAAEQLTRETRGCSQHTGGRRSGAAQPGARS